MHVLLLYPYLPHPGVAHGSGRLVEPLLRLWRQRGVSVTLVCGFRPREREFVEATRASVARLYAVETPLRVDRPHLGRLLETCRTAFLEAATGRPRHVVKLDRAPMRAALKRALDEGSFDVAQVEIGGAAAYADAFGDLPKVLVDHEAGTASGDGLDSEPRTLAFVRAAYPRFDRVVALCEEDAADLKAAVPGLIVSLRRPGVVPPALSRAVEAIPGRLLFFGSAEHVPNHDAFARLADVIAPRVRAAFPAASFAVATGDLPPALTAKLDAAGIERLGFVKDILAEIRRAAVVVAPLYKGRGVRIKNVEALAAGRPLVTTPLGARGLLLESGRHALVVDDDAKFVEAVVSLLRDPSKAETMGAEGRERLLRTFTHEAAADANVDLWRELLGR